MGQLIKPNITKIVTKNGECQVSISLDLNINLTTNGLQINALSTVEEQPKPEEKTNWVVPDFKSGKPKIKFGQEVKE